MSQPVNKKSQDKNIVPRWFQYVAVIWEIAVTKYDYWHITALE